MLKHAEHPGRNPASVVKGASLVTTSRNNKPSRTFNVSGTDKMDGSWVKSNILAWRVLD
jgi:hypothetical protein